MKQVVIKDEFIIYKSEEEDCFIAHGLHTDQIGIGNTAGEAYRDFIECLKAILRFCAINPDVHLYREAPEKYKKKGTPKKITVVI